MVVNGGTGKLTPCGVLRFFASELAPTGKCQPSPPAWTESIHQTPFGCRRSPQRYLPMQLQAQAQIVH